MATKIKLKRKTAKSTTDIYAIKLNQGEPLYDATTQTLYVGQSDGDDGSGDTAKELAVQSASFLRSRDSSRTQLLSADVDTNGNRYIFPENDEDNDHFLRIGSASYPFESITVGKVKKSTDPDGTIKPQIKIDGTSITPNTDKVANIGASEKAFAHVYAQQNDANIIRTLNIPNADSVYTIENTRTSANNIVVLPSLAYNGQVYPNKSGYAQLDGTYTIADNEKSKHFVVDNPEVFMAQVLNYIAINYTVVIDEGKTLTQSGTYVSAVEPSSRGTIIVNVYSGSPIPNYTITDEWTYTASADMPASFSNAKTMTRQVNGNKVTDTYKIGSLPPYCSGIYITLDGAIYTFGTSEARMQDKYWFVSGQVVSQLKRDDANSAIGAPGEPFKEIYADTFYGDVTGGTSSFKILKIGGDGNTIQIDKTGIKPTAIDGSNSLDIGTQDTPFNQIVATTFNGSFNGALSGNASSASKLEQSRQLQVSLSTTEQTSFDGSANVDIGVKDVLGVTNGGTGKSDLNDVSVGAATNATNIAIIDADDAAGYYRISLSGTTLTLTKNQA